MFGKNSKAGKCSKNGKMSTKSRNVEASNEATKGCSSKSNASTKNCK